MRQSVYCLASDNICSLIEHWFYSGSLSCHINLTPCVLLSGESTISPKFGSMLRPGRITVLFFLHSHGPLQWDGRSGSTEVVIDHTGLLILPDVIFMFSSCRRGGGKSLFYKCLLLFSAGEKSRVWRECGVTCQSKPAETRWVSPAVALGINSQFIEIPLIHLARRSLLSLITLWFKMRDSQAWALNPDRLNWRHLQVIECKSV